MRIHAFLTSALLAPVLLAQRAPEVEPNDTVAQAQSVVQGTEVVGNLVAAETDWYSFTTSGGQVRITTNGLDTKITLWDATGLIAQAFSDDVRALFSSDITINLPAGAYTVQVQGFSATTTGPYSIDVSVDAAPKAYTGLEVEPNENVSQAQLIANGAQINGALAAPVAVLADAVAASASVLTDIVLSSTTTVITATAPLVASAYVPGHSVMMTSGANIGLIRAISANTATTITTAAWPVANLAGDTYDIITTSSTTLIRTTAALTPSAYVGGAYFVRFTSGANSGQDRQISANTANSLTCLAFATAPAASDTFEIVQADVDVYQVVLTAPRTGLWFQVTEGDAPWLTASRYEIWDSAGALLTPTATLGANNGASSTLNSRQSQIRVWPAGTYHFVVRRQPSITTVNNIIPYGNYRLEYVEMPMNTGGVVAEVESNNTFATATPIAPGQQGTGNLTISTGADASDWWGPITLSSPSVLQFQTGLGAAPAIADTTINLRAYDPITNTVGAPTAVTTGNILDPTSHARGTFIFTLTPNQYYLEVVSPLATTSGNYVLEIGAVISTPYCVASYALVTANAACGVAPFPTITRQFTNEVPMIGQTFARSVTNCVPNGPVLLLQGLSNQIAIANGNAPLPVDLTPFGAPGCTINVDPAAITFYLADGAGILDLIQNTPPVVALRGLPIYEQAAVLNLGANALGLQVSNYARQIIGDRSY